MSDDKKININPSGIGFGGLLAILFIGLKLTGYISWSWWWVLSPLWIPLSFAALCLIAAFLISIIILLINDRR